MMSTSVRCGLYINSEDYILRSYNKEGQLCGSISLNWEFWFSYNNLGPVDLVLRLRDISVAFGNAIIWSTQGRQNMPNNTWFSDSIYGLAFKFEFRIRFADSIIRLNFRIGVLSYLRSHID